MSNAAVNEILRDMNTITVKRTDCADPDFIKLVNQLTLELRVRNGSVMQEFFEQFNIIADVDTVVLAYCDGEPAGCGCFKAFEEGSVEVKRMFTIPEKRGLRIAAMILAELEAWAREMGNTRIVLETGTRLQEALALYTRSGYVRVAQWGQYIGVAESVCMGKEL